MLVPEGCDRVKVGGAGRLVVVPGVRYLSSEDAVLAGMLDGWRNQQLFYGSRNSALRNLIQLAPAPIVADMLGYSYQVTARHNELAATTYARYAQSLGDTITTLNP